MKRIATLTSVLLVPFVIATALDGHAAGNVQNTRLKLEQLWFNGSSGEFAPGQYVSLAVSTFVDSTGAVSGAVDLQWLDENGWWHLANCGGPHVFGALQIHPSTGATSVSVTLDPAVEGCYTVDASTISLVLTGIVDPDYRTSANLSGTQREGGTVYHYNARQDCFRILLTGALPLPNVQGVTGEACNYRNR